MKYKKKQHSILFTTLAPIFITTFLILLFASITISTIYVKETLDASIQSNLEILKQTDVSLQLVHNHIHQVSSNIIQKPYLGDLLLKPWENKQDEWNGRFQIKNIFESNPTAMVNYEVTIAGLNGLLISSGYGGSPLTAEKLLNLPVFKRSLTSNKIEYISLSNGISYSTSNSAVILGCRPLIKADGTLCGGIFISIPEEDLRHFYQSFINKRNDILLLSHDGTVLSSNHYSDIGNKNDILLKHAIYNRKQNLTYSKTGNKDIIISRYIPYSDSYVISKIETASIHHNFLPKLETCCIIIFALCILFLCIIEIMKNNLLPLQKIADHMDSAKDIPTPIHNIEGASEINLITNSYNKMTESLNIYLEELKKANEKQRKDELDLLQMQINPHFLYNTLDSVKHLIEMQNHINACKIIESLISLLRSTLGKTNTMVSVEDEVKNVKNYISIIEPRYGGLIKADVHVEENCLGYEIPNLLLQPLVENAFFHAFQETKTGLIRIYISSANKELFCEIIDNGDGMDNEQLMETLKNSKVIHQPATKIGIGNIRERLNILYPDANTFQITSEPGYGTNITLSFPAIIHLTENPST